MAQISNIAGEAAGSRRLYPPLARKLAGKLANAVLCLHSQGIVHAGRVITGRLVEHAHR